MVISIYIYLYICPLPAIYHLCQSMPGTFQGQAGTSLDKAGTNRDKKETNRDKHAQPVAVPACPCLSCLSMNHKIARLKRKKTDKGWISLDRVEWIRLTRDILGLTLDQQ